MSDSKKSLVLGVTGFAGSGKSFLCGVLRELGWKTINADAVVADLYFKDNAGYTAILNEFGADFVNDDGVDKTKLVAAIQADAALLPVLNSIIHPLVKEKISTMIANFLDENSSAKIAIEAVYFETGGLYDLIDQLLLVGRPIEFVKTVEPFHSYLVEFYVDSMPKPDIVIENNEDLDHFRAKVIEFFLFLPYK